MTSEKSLARNINIDLVKSIAVSCVVGVHFFLNSGFYDVPQSGISLYAGSLFRTFFMVCLPLFMITTGYLMKNKKLNRHYYFGIRRTLLIYFISSSACLLYRAYYLNEAIGISTSISYMLGFGASGYAWYIDMYIGLFLLIPFLNILYESLADKTRRLALLITLFALVSLPSQFNFSISFFPDSWMGIYPLFFYFLGAYFRDYSVSISKSKLGVLFIVWVIFCSVINVLISRLFNDGLYIFSDFNAWASLENIASSILLFQLLIKLRLPVDGMLPKAITMLSKLSLATYLMSWMVDTTVYPIVRQFFPTYSELSPLAPLIIAFNTLCSFLLAYIVTTISELILRVVKYLKYSRL